MTISGVDVTTAATLMAAIGDVSRFPSPRHLAGYLGLDPKLRQSGVAGQVAALSATADTASARKGRWRRGALTAAVALAAVGCGGADEKAAAGRDGEETVESQPRSAEFELAQRSELGTKTALVTFTSRTDGKTSAIVNFYVPRTGKSNVYPVAIHRGTCEDLGERAHFLGDLGAGITVRLLDAGYDQVTGPLSAADSVVVIFKPDGKKNAWCGP